MGYNLPDHEIFILNKEYGIPYRKLAEEWGCGQSAIGNHVRQFEELLDSGDVDAIELYEITSMKFKRVPEYVDMIEDMKMEQNDNYTNKMDKIVEENYIEKTEHLLNDKTAAEINSETEAEAEYNGICPEESAEDMKPVGIREKIHIPWYRKLWNWLKWW